MWGNLALALAVGCVGVFTPVASIMSSRSEPEDVRDKEKFMTSLKMTTEP